MKKYPVCGPREPVYELMRSLGLHQARWTDKYWYDDKLEVLIYGAGSRARVRKMNSNHAMECELDVLAERLGEFRS